MTPQLLQAIKLLQLSQLDLAAYVDAELERNPLLERIEGDSAGDAAADRGQHLTFDALRGQRAGDQRLIAAGKEDIAVILDQRDDGGVLGGHGRALAMNGGKGDVKAVIAKHRDRLGADDVGLRGGGWKHHDPAAGQAVHFSIDRIVIVLKPAADDGQLGIVPRKGHAFQSHYQPERSEVRMWGRSARHGHP
ncbi:MAG TPA: hypothetical protein PLI13_17690 [Paracoccus sp. (in: a-proteobacteria)]|nr:hypothetical protein [Paracoccus sp. (in: a-proteobacteria)]